MHTALKVRSVASIAAILTLIACGGSQKPASDAANAVTHTVVMDATRFEPASLTVKAGDSIVWVNKDFFPHTATSQAGGFDSGEIKVGASWKYTTSAKGEFAYICTYHRTMKGTLKVE